MENEQPNYYKAEPEPIMTEGDGDSNEDDELSYFLQELMYPEPGCIDTLMNPNPNPNPKLGHPEEDGPAVEVVQSNNGGDGLVHDQPSSMESSSPISRSNLGVQAGRVISDLEVLGPRLDQVMSLSSSVDTGGDPIEKDHMSNPKRKKPIGWTHEEHTAFLEGILGGFKGDWKYMSNFFVKSRSPTQIASHAQKYFKRQQSGNPKRRKSINDITLSNISLQIPEHPTAAAGTSRVSFPVNHQQALPSLYNIRQSAPNNSLPHPNPNPSPNPNPEWVLPVGTDHLIQHPLPPPPPPPVEEGRLYMSRQRHDESSSSSYIPADHVPAVLSPLPQRMVLPANYSLNPHAYAGSAHCICRGSTIEHNPHHQPQTLTSSSTWPLQQHNYYRSYNDYYPSSIMPLQQSLRRLDSSNAVNMGPAAPQPLPADQDSNNINFYP